MTPRRIAKTLRDAAKARAERARIDSEPRSRPERCPHKAQVIRVLHDGWYWQVCQHCQTPVSRIRKVEWNAEKPLPDGAA